MELITKIKIKATAQASFEAFADPDKIGNFWFGTSSQRWETGRDIMLIYPEVDGIQVQIRVLETVQGEKIVFAWGEEQERRTVVITFEPSGADSTLVKVSESPWAEDASAIEGLIQNKEGWVFMLTCLKAWLENCVNSLRLGMFTDV